MVQDYKVLMVLNLNLRPKSHTSSQSIILLELIYQYMNFHVNINWYYYHYKQHSFYNTPRSLQQFSLKEALNHNNHKNYWNICSKNFKNIIIIISTINFIRPVIQILLIFSPILIWNANRNILVLYLRKQSYSCTYMWGILTKPGSAWQGVIMRKMQNFYGVILHRWPNFGWKLLKHVEARDKC